MEAVLAGSYPAVHRMALALTGEQRLAQRVIRYVLRRAVRVMPRWRKGITPENWFYHHTLLVAREASAGAAPGDRDLLVIAGPVAHTPYVAFVRALRGLPRQQMEAFILHHGEKLNARLLGVAMDCSAAAAGTHLNAATELLKTMSVESFPSLTAALERAYTTLTPPETVIRTAVAQQTGAALLALRARRALRLAVWACVLLLGGWAVWHWHSLLLQWFEAARSKAQTQSS